MKTKQKRQELGAKEEKEEEPDVTDEVEDWGTNEEEKEKCDVTWKKEQRGAK